MHKRLVNHCTLELSLIPDGPILIKSGKEGADPTKPDMEFVETYHAGGKTVYLPGSGLKGAIRAQAERIVRTIGSDRRDPNNPDLLWANDPLKDEQAFFKDKSSTEIYHLSSFTDQLFGNTSLASRLRVDDAYPIGTLKLEERNGVAIDRVFGSVAVGPFNYQVCTAGEFKTKIHLKNFTLAQLALVGLVLRDLNEGWFGLGFAKSRGLGTVQVKYHRAVVQYPGCVLSDNDRIQRFGHEQSWERTTLLGVGEFLTDIERQAYGFLPGDIQTGLPVAAQEIDGYFGVELTWAGETVTDLFQRTVKFWQQRLRGVAA
jgi:CRISPR/Cas system CSM-associated protein Csm3 (group 7 of RAMP superfamily)